MTLKSIHQSIAIYPFTLFIKLVIIQIFTKKSSSSCRAISMDIPDPLSTPLHIVHYFRLVLRATPRILTELMYVGSSWSPVFARPCEGVNRSTSFISSSLLLQQCPACLVRLTWIVFVMGGRWPNSCCLIKNRY